MESCVNISKIKDIIDARGCSLFWLSTKTGIPYRRIIDLISGRKKWTVGDAKAVANALDLTAKDRRDIFF